MASWSVTALAVQTLASFLLQVVAATTIGASGYGKYAIILGLLSTLTALQSGLRDAAIVLEPSAMHGSVLAAQYLANVAAAAIAVVVGARSDLTSSGGAFLLAAMVSLWGFEEMGRRYLIRDQRFGAVVLNDLVYAAGAFGTVGVMYLVQGELSLSSFLWAMSAGSFASFGVSVVQLPTGTYSLRSASVRDMQSVLSFAGWRSAQNAIRPASITLTRVVIAGIASVAILGQLETARLVMQPVWVLISGLGPFLLSHFARSRESGGRVITDKLAGLSAGFAAMAAVWCAVVIVLADLVQPILVGDDYPVDRLAIAAWGSFYVAAAVGFPMAVLLVASKKALRVFLARATDGVIGLAAVAVLAVGPGARWTPFGLMFGAATGTVILWRMGRTLAEPLAPGEPAEPQRETELAPVVP